MSRLEEEIEYIHSSRTEPSYKNYIRPIDMMFKVVLSATNTYTNLSLFWNDIVNDGRMSDVEKKYALNDLYLLSLLHVDEEEFDEVYSRYLDEEESIVTS